jgi:hypothetical protein
VFALPPADWLGPSPIWDVLVDLVEVLSSEPGPRAIVLVTDGLATGNARTAAHVEAAARAAAVGISVVFEETIVTLSPMTTMAEAIGRDPAVPLERIATATGGRFFRLRGIVTPGQPCVTRDPSPLLARALGHMRTESRLAPAPVTSWRWSR